MSDQPSVTLSEPIDYPAVIDAKLLRATIWAADAIIRSPNPYRQKTYAELKTKLFAQVTEQNALKQLEQENAALRELAEGLKADVEAAPHGRDCKLGQPVARYGHPSATGDMPCTCWKANSAARYRAACPGEGQPSSASNSPTASRESQG
jgi:hypothetical protein